MSFIFNIIHLNYFPNSLLQLLTMSCRLCSGLLSHSVCIMWQLWCKRVTQSWNSLSRVILCSRISITEKNDRKCEIDSSVSWLVPFSWFSLYPGYLNDFFFLQEKEFLVSFSGKDQRLFLFLKVSMEFIMQFEYFMKLLNSFLNCFAVADLHSWAQEATTSTTTQEGFQNQTS